MDNGLLYDQAPPRPKESMLGLILLAAIALCAGVLANRYVNKSAMGLTFGITCGLIVGMVNIRKALILAMVFAAFNSAHLLIDTSVTIITEPFLNKAMKDILFLGVIVSYLKTSMIENLRPMKMEIMAPLAIFGVFVVLHSIIVSDGAWLLTMTWYRHYIAHPVLALIAFSAFRTLDEVRLLFKWLLGTAVVIVAVGFLEQLLNLPTQFQDTVSFWIFNRRVISTLGQPVNVYQYIGLPFFFILIGWITSQIKFIKAMTWLSILGYGIFMTFTRLAFIAFPFALLLLSFVIKRARSIYVGVVLLVLIILAFPLVMSARDQFGAVSGNVLSSRDVMVKEEIGEIFSDPKILLVGDGMGSGMEIGAIQASFNTTDNIYIAWWRATGTLGLFFFVGIFFWVGIQLIRTYKRCQTEAGQHLVGAITAYYFMLVAAGVGCEVFKFYPATFLLWVSVGIALSIPHIEQDEYLFAGTQVGYETNAVFVEDWS